MHAIKYFNHVLTR